MKFMFLLLILSCASTVVVDQVLDTKPPEKIYNVKIYRVYENDTTSLHYEEMTIDQYLESAGDRQLWMAGYRYELKEEIKK